MEEIVPIWNDAGESSSPTPAQVRRELVELARELLKSTGATGIAIATSSPAGQQGSMVCVAAEGPSAPPLGTVVNVNSGLSGRAVRENRTLHSFDTALDPRVDAEVCEQLGIRSLVIVPLHREGRCIGILEAFSDRRGAFDESKIKKLEEEGVLAAAFTEPETATPVPASDAAEGQPVVVDLEASPAVAEAVETENHSSADITANEVNVEQDVGKASDSEPELALGPAEPEPPEPEASTSLPPPARRPRNLRVWGLAACATLIVVIASPFVIDRFNARPPLNAQPTPAPVSSSPAANESSQPPAPVENPDAKTVQPLIDTAEHGNAKAQYRLAQRYLAGDGVPQDRIKGTTWLIVAGAQGNAEAKRSAVQITHSLTPFEIGQVRFNVGKLYESGTGVPTDPIAAYFWLELAKDAGDIRAVPEQEKLEATMSPEQLGTAKQRASAWTASHRYKQPQPSSLATARH